MQWLAREVLEGETRGFDEAVLLPLRDSSDPAITIGPAWMLSGMQSITSLGSIVVISLITTLITIFLLIAGRRLAGLYLVIAVLGGWLASNRSASCHSERSEFSKRPCDGVDGPLPSA